MAPTFRSSLSVQAIERGTPAKGKLGGGACASGLVASAGMLWEYRTVAVQRQRQGLPATLATLDAELNQLGGAGFEVVGMSDGWYPQTLVVTLKRPAVP